MSSLSVPQASATSPEPVKVADARASEAAAAPEQEAQVRRVGWATLPTEVIAAIVKLVKEQDRLLIRRGLESCNGIAALSLVNKQLRAMTIGLLGETVPAESIGDALFRYDKIPDSLVAGIRALDCTDASDNSLVAAAPLLKRLKNLDKLDMTLRDYPLLRPYHAKASLPESEYQLARGAYRENAPHITRFIMKDEPDHGDTATPAAFLRFFADPAHLVELTAILNETWESIFGPHTRTFQSLVANCVQLRKLKVRERYTSSTASLTPEQQTRWRAGLDLPALKVLSLPAADVAAVDFIHSWAPDIETLTLDFAESMPSPDPSPGGADDVCTTFANLRKLSLKGPPPVTKVLNRVTLDTLACLKIEIKQKKGPIANNVRADFDVSTLFPADLQLPRAAFVKLTLPYAYDMYTPFENGVALRKRMLERDIDLRKFVLGPSAPFLPDFQAQFTAKDDDGLALQRQQKLIHKMLDYGHEEGERCEIFGDVAGTQRLAEALEPVHQLWLSEQV